MTVIRSRTAAFAFIILSAILRAQDPTPVSAGSTIGPMVNPFAEILIYQVTVRDAFGDFTQEALLGWVAPGATGSIDIPEDPALCGLEFQLCLARLATPPIQLGCQIWVITCP